MTVARVLAGEARWHVEQGDCLDVLRAMPDASVDAVVTDPPAGIAFMGKGWDTDKGGRDVWIAWLAEIMREALRALKPGGHALVWALPRTSHWTATAVEDAGFEIRDVGVHLFGSGFPKSLDVSKAIDKAAGATREVVGSQRLTGRAAQSTAEKGGTYTAGAPASDGCVKTIDLTAPATPLAERWNGWGTALKPASEHWILARKPLVGTVAANVAEYGTGAINVDACRVGTESTRRDTGTAAVWGNAGRIVGGSDAGRFPANVTLAHLPECREVGVRRAQRNVQIGSHGASASVNAYGDGLNNTSTTGVSETVPAYDCAPGCAVAALDEQSGELRARGNVTPTRRRRSDGVTGWGVGDDGPVDHGDTGGASRFYYVAKASRAERHAGLPPRGNRHETVKPIALMRWLARLVTPPVVVDVVCPRCHCASDEAEAMRGVLESVHASATRAEAVLHPVSKRRRRKGAQDSNAAPVLDVRNGVHPEGQGVGVLLGAVSGELAAEAGAAVSAMRGDVSPEAHTAGATREVLLDNVRRSGAEEAIRATVSIVSAHVLAAGRGNGALLEGVRRADERSREAQAAPSDDGGIPRGPSAWSPDGESAGLCDGTPPRDGGAPWPDAAPSRGGAPHQRGEDGQQDREPRTAHEGRARQDLEASAEADCVPALRQDDQALGTCPHCGSGLTERRRAGVVLDPFCGSGSTGCACALEGFRFVGIEREAEYVEIARARIAHWEAQATAPAKPKRAPKLRPVPTPPPSAPHPVDARQLDLLARLA